MVHPEVEPSAPRKPVDWHPPTVTETCTGRNKCIRDDIMRGEDDEVGRKRRQVVRRFPRLTEGSGLNEAVSDDFTDKKERS